MVDLEQFRLAVAAFKVVATQAKQPDAIAEADRLLSIIDSAGEVERRDREADRARFTDPDFNDWLDCGISDCGHTVYDSIDSIADAWQGWNAHVVAALRQQPAPVVDEAMVERALNAKVGNWPVRQLFDSECDARIAMRAALTVALSSVQGVESP